MKARPLECPNGGPHQWKAKSAGIVCDRCGMSTHMLAELRKAQLSDAFEERRERREVLNEHRTIYRPVRRRQPIIVVGSPG